MSFFLNFPLLSFIGNHLQNFKRSGLTRPLEINGKTTLKECLLSFYMRVVDAQRNDYKIIKTEVNIVSTFVTKT